MGGLEQVESHITFQMQIRRCEHLHKHTHNICVLANQKSKKKNVSFLPACLLQTFWYVVPMMTMIIIFCFFFLVSLIFSKNSQKPNSNLVQLQVNVTAAASLEMRGLVLYCHFPVLSDYIILFPPFQKKQETEVR